MTKSPALTVGWREWVELPELGIPAIKVKIDTGARTSALHALDIERVKKNGRDLVKFAVPPIQRNKTVVVACEAPLVDIRSVSDSGGHAESRYVISSRLVIAGVDKEIDITLTQRDKMLFRMLIGRTALADDMLVNPAASFLCGRKSARLLYARSDHSAKTLTEAQK